MNGGPVDRHRAEATEVLAGGEASEIKRLYVDLGDDLWEAHAGDPDTVPLFSLAGTHPVVADALSEVQGVVLDAGCGPNPALSISLASGPRRTVSLDIGLGTVRSALAVARARGVELLGVVGDVEALPFRSGAFDAVACDDTIEHLPDDHAGVAELARVVRPGSPVVIATPNRRSLGILRLKAIDRLRGRRKPASSYFVSNSHLREYTWHELGDLVEPVLSVEERRGVRFDGHRAPALLVRVANPLVVRWPFRGLSPMLVLVTTSRR